MTGILTHRLAWLLAVLLPTTVASAVAAAAQPREPRTLVLRGRVLCEDGTPLAHARISVHGARSAGAWTDAGGFYQVDARLDPPARLAGHGLALRVAATRPGWHIELPGGVPALEAWLRCEPAGACSLMATDVRVGEALVRCLEPGGPPGAVALLQFVAARRLVLFGAVRSRDLRGVRDCELVVRGAGGATLAAARSREDGTFELVLDPRVPAGRIEVAARHGDFTLTPAVRAFALREADRMGPVLFSASPRAGVDGARLAAVLGPRRAQARPRAPVGEELAFAYAAAVSLPVTPRAHATAAPRRRERPVAPWRSERRSVPQPAAAAAESLAVAPPVPDRGPPAPPVASAPPGPAATADPDCRCRVRGIVELRADDLVSPAPRVEVSLVPGGGSATVDFFMGAPRGFELGAVPCGRYRVQVRSLGRERWQLLNPQGISDVYCVGGSDNEVRLILERR